MKKNYVILLILLLSNLVYAGVLPHQFIEVDNESMSENVTINMTIINGTQFYPGQFVDFEIEICNGGETSVTGESMLVSFTEDILDFSTFTSNISSDDLFAEPIVTSFGQFAVLNIDVPPNTCVYINYSMQIFFGSPVGIVTGNSGIFACDNTAYNSNVTFEILNCVAQSCPGDLNNDGLINSEDLLQFLGAWNTTCTSGCCPEDFNGDLVINQADLNIILGAFGTSCFGGNGSGNETRKVEYVQKFTYAPNPVQNQVDFQFKTYPFLTNYLEIYSIQGALINRYEDLDEKGLTVDMAEWSKGLYIVHFFNGIELEVVKIVKASK